MDAHDTAVAGTSDWMAVMRRDEHARPDRFLADPWARLLAHGPAETEVARAYALCGPSGVVIGRGRYGDGLTAHACAEGVRQVVSLGAGSDTRPWRLRDLPPGLTWWEIDLPGRLAGKTALLARHAPPPVCRYVAVDADLRDPVWPRALAAAGHDGTAPTLWLAEGLFYYLTRPEALALTHTLTARCARGSHLVFDVPHTAFADDPAKAGFLAHMRERGSPFTGSADHPRDLLPPGRWHTDAHLPDDLAAGACPWMPPLPERVARDHRLVWYAHAWR